MYHVADDERKLVRERQIEVVVRHLSFEAAPTADIGCAVRLWRCDRKQEMNNAGTSCRMEYFMKGKTSCDSCTYYIYDAEYDTYFCDVCLDEDEMEKFLTDTFRDCPYYLMYDEYKIVQKQN